MKRFYRAVVHPEPSCPGCGAVFQYSNKIGHGFLQRKPDLTPISPQRIKQLESLPILTPSEAQLLVNHMKQKKLKCARCNSNHHALPLHFPDPAKLYAGIKTTSNNTILHVASVLDYQHTLTSLTRHVGTSSIVIPVLNKMDLIPPATFPIIARQIAKHYTQPPSFISAKLGLGIQDLVDRINEQKSERIHVIGHTNVGKSALMNAFLELAGKSKQITVHDGFGTTLKPIPIETETLSGLFKSAITIIDTPGLESPSSNNSILNQPLIHRGNSFARGFSFVIGDSLRIDVLGDSLNMSFYGNESNLTRRCRISEFEEYKDEFGKEQIVHIKPDKTNWDICISGVGWVTLNSKTSMHLRVYCKSKIVLRKSILKIDLLYPLEYQSKTS